MKAKWQIRRMLEALGVGAQADESGNRTATTRKATQRSISRIDQ